jgi:hypothetical protein
MMAVVKGRKICKGSERCELQCSNFNSFFFNFWSEGLRRRDPGCIGEDTLKWSLEEQRVKMKGECIWLWIGYNDRLL